MRKQSITIAVQTSYWEGGRENGFRARARKLAVEPLSHLLRIRETVLRGGGAGRCSQRNSVAGAREPERDSSPNAAQVLLSRVQLRQDQCLCTAISIGNSIANVYILSAVSRSSDLGRRLVTMTMTSTICKETVPY